ncbi:MAG: aminotransferase class V-fold PLP-dependent enzyme, partial [Actinomycetota bacterium]
MTDADTQPLAERAAALDAVDPLRSFRDRFVIEDDLVYLDGNSLGRLPRGTSERISTAVESDWSTRLVLGWDSWLDMGLRLGDMLAPLIGAENGEVAIADQTSINLYKLASAGLAASGRVNVLTDSGNFPSDRYMLSSVAEAAGGRLVIVPEDPTPDDLARHLDQTVGLVSLSHVSYRSGRMMDGHHTTRVVHDAGAMMLWDLAHSVGSVPVDLSDWNADLAVGCTYKYLNAGPGAPGFLYVRSDLQTMLTQPLTGWFGHADQFGFNAEWTPAHDIRRFLVGTPPVISMTGVEVGVALTAEAGTEAIRNKSIAMTSFFIDAVRSLDRVGVTIATPLVPSQR